MTADTDVRRRAFRRERSGHVLLVVASQSNDMLGRLYAKIVVCLSRLRRPRARVAEDLTKYVRLYRDHTWDDDVAEVHVRLVVTDGRTGEHVLCGRCRDRLYGIMMSSHDAIVASALFPYVENVVPIHSCRRDTPQSTP